VSERTDIVGVFVNPDPGSIILTPTTAPNGPVIRESSGVFTPETVSGAPEPGVDPGVLVAG